MKPKNFPARKLRRQLRAENGFVEPKPEQLSAARTIRTKKKREAKIARPTN